jgi:hypothetical protein
VGEEVDPVGSRWAALAWSSGIAATTLRTAERSASANGDAPGRARAIASAAASSGVKLTGGSVWLLSTA